MALGNKVPHVKHGKYISEIKTNMSMYKQIAAPQILIAGKEDIDGADFSIGWSLLTEPFLMVAESHSHDFNQVIFFWGGDPNNVSEFDADIELTLDGEVNLITYPSMIWTPKGLDHGPLNIKRIGKPVSYIDITLTPSLSFRPVPKESQR